LLLLLALLLLLLLPQCGSSSPPALPSGATLAALIILMCLFPAAAVVAVWELFTACSAFKGHFGNVVQRVVAGERPPLPEEAPEEYNLLMMSW
jgi:hypothetical protein